MERIENIQIDTNALSALLEELADLAHASLTAEFLLVAGDTAHGLVLWERRVKLKGTVFEFEGDIRMGGSCAGDGGGNLLVGNVAPGTVEVGVNDEVDGLECGYMDAGAGAGAGSHCRSASLVSRRCRRGRSTDSVGESSSSGVSG
jgi:hypothetical protein